MRIIVARTIADEIVKWHCLDNDAGGAGSHGAAVRLRLDVGGLASLGVHGRLRGRAFEMGPTRCATMLPVTPARNLRRVTRGTGGWLGGRVGTSQQRGAA